MLLNCLRNIDLVLKVLVLLLVCSPVHAHKFLTFNFDLNDHKPFDSKQHGDNPFVWEMKYIGQQGKDGYSLYEVSLEHDLHAPVFQPDENIKIAEVLEGRRWYYINALSERFGTYVLMVTPKNKLSVRLQALQKPVTKQACQQRLKEASNLILQIYHFQHRDFRGDMDTVKASYSKKWQRHYAHIGHHLMLLGEPFHVEPKTDGNEFHRVLSSDDFIGDSKPLRDYEPYLAAEKFTWVLQDSVANIITGLKCVNEGEAGFALQHTILGYRGLFKLDQEQRSLQREQAEENYKKERQQQLENEYEF